ncbi:YccS/YhfK family membrane protein [Halovivax limisalsi]|uniref:YccS/YhfK family membrane protein n=1 Tax=Halovivax limisalsi TaxID=1453760 RepID=UPI001FFCCA53|nr:YccS/YhfK family membrane protein [Halovivax limisalsi]
MTGAEPEDDDRSADTDDEVADRGDRSTTGGRESIPGGDGEATEDEDHSVGDDGGTADGAGSVTGVGSATTDDNTPIGDPSAPGESHPAIELLGHVRTDRRDHWIAMGIAAAVGLAFAWLHWFGLVLGGALVGLIATTPPRAPLAGFGFGGLVLAVFTAWLGGVAAVVALQMQPVTYVLVGASLGLPVFGSLVRWLE